MNVQNASTRAAAPATEPVVAPVTCMVSADTINKLTDDIGLKGGLIDRANAAKHLSSLVMDEIESMLGDRKGRPGHIEGSRDFTFFDFKIDTFTWLVSELWSVNQELADAIAAFGSDFIDVSNAAFYAREAAKAQGERAAK